MPATPPDAADAAPFAADGPGGAGSVGVVVSHGFTGTPASMRPWAQHLADAGFSVRLPLLPGHGATWRETNRTRWPQWYEAIESTFAELRERCDTVLAMGLSMGGTLVTRLAEQHPETVAGLVLVNPAYGTRRVDAKLAPYIGRLVRSRPSIGGDIKKPGVAEPAADRTPVLAFASLQQLWKATVADLPRVTAPVLLYRSREDHVVDDLSVELLHRGAVNTTVREVVLEDSYHVATLDNDAPTIFAGSVDFARTIAGVGAP
ncbi:carboxylesterase [Jatrophihabitans endophyticus]|uniref:Carboxylesterase n=1 Tax=Jatrophihabitans endophyticus TaxID=1206085 RepID=A0A1M5L689_9ACTN|nr:alpha/beta fold hydrolase [Jatrophihabitans endophyticus]SHG59943.1 carboxylesterase [Jatrophihabitans endophyticus]